MIDGANIGILRRQAKMHGVVLAEWSAEKV